jgi:hypothetical protein
VSKFATLGEIRDHYYLGDIFDANEILSLKLQLELSAAEEN